MNVELHRSYGYTQLNAFCTTLYNSRRRVRLARTAYAWLALLLVLACFTAPSSSMANELRVHYENEISPGVFRKDWLVYVPKRHGVARSGVASAFVGYSKKICAAGLFERNGYPKWQDGGNEFELLAANFTSVIVGWSVPCPSTHVHISDALRVSAELIGAYLGEAEKGAATGKALDQVTEGQSLCLGDGASSWLELKIITWSVDKSADCADFEDSIVANTSGVMRFSWID